VTLQERIHSDTIAAMRSGDTLRRDTLRMATSALYNAEKAGRRPLTDDEALAVVTREVKTRRESVEAYRAAGRADLADKEEAEIVILREFLPEPLTDAELEALVAEGISASGATSPRDLGRVMGWLSPRIRGRADGRRASELVAAALARTDLAVHDAGGH
jgi:uncharacterized protein YqeY